MTSSATLPSTSTLTERFFCSVCGKNYLRKRHLQRHMRDECIGIPPRFECELCPSKFRRKYHLVRHLSARHGVAPPAGTPVMGGASDFKPQPVTEFQLPPLTSATTMDLSMKKENVDVSSSSVNNVMNNFSVDAIMMKNENFDAIVSSSKYKFFEDLRLKLGLTFSPDSLFKDHQIKY